ncbi:AT-rich interactive domain-containing protein 2 [Trachymyrmex cornetzi]|uniref:AT-rich interactive domain-containing protein 2 n=1 Tax=Trachymyrmex cornetzi TaxID=471704 RepID=A0A195DUX8_9HYME|nr:AT-rich interactive domain-containing protein 2 [Trachymyrmex cornetzi]
MRTPCEVPLKDATRLNSDCQEGPSPSPATSGRGVTVTAPLATMFHCVWQSASVCKRQGVAAFCRTANTTRIGIGPYAPPPFSVSRTTYLDRYEKVHFLGEDGQQADDDDEDSRHRKWSARALHSVPLTYNHHQHNIAAGYVPFSIVFLLVALSSSLCTARTQHSFPFFPKLPLPLSLSTFFSVCTYKNKQHVFFYMCPYAFLRGETPLGKKLIFLFRSEHQKLLINMRDTNTNSVRYYHCSNELCKSLRDYNGLSSDLYKSSNYDKLALSLLSPLPNEQDFAINVCTLLSNEGKHTLRLDKYPRLVNILLAHAGVFDSPGTRQLFIEVYSRIRNYSINSFWSDVLDSQDVIDLTDERTFMKKPLTSSLSTFSRRKTVEKEKQSKQDVIALTTENEEPTVPNDVEMILPDCPRLDLLVLHSDENLKDQNQNSIKFEEEDKDLFCVGRTLGTQDPYGQRVLQIASILRNLSFTPENATVLGRNRCFLRFVLLCVRARWSNLHQLGFDILGNIANEVILKEAGERITNVVLTCVAKGIESQDRFIVISCLEVLNKISQQDSNEEIVTFGLADNVYELICRQVFLALSDIALLVYTLECLYALTSLGERPCTSVARVRGAIDTLVALVTVEAQSYGPKACILMRVVETVSTVAAQQNTTGQSSVPASPATPATTTASASTPSTPATITTIPAPASPASSRPTTPAATSTKSTTHKVVETANAIQQQNAHQQIIQENEQFALGWVKATFELIPGVRIEQEELYKKYLGCCTKIGRRGVIAPLHFPRCVRSVFGNIVGPNPLKGENTGTQYYEGIRVRATPAPITYPSQTTAAVATNTLPIPAVNTTPVKVLPVQQRTVKNISPAPDSTAAPQVDSPAASFGTQTTSTPASPILKAQLSAPPKPPSNNTSSQSQNPVTKVDSKSQVSVSHPHLSQALLASGSQTPPQQQPQLQPQLQCVQVVAKEDNRSGTTSSSIIKSLLATKVTVSSDCMPSAAATCVSTPTACVTNTTASIASSISANQLITSNQVAQRQQQQRLLQQQMTSIIQPAAPAATPATILPKTLINTKQKPAITPIPAKKIQRLNGAKFVVTNNCEKTEINDNDNTNQIITSTTTVVNPTENHISSSPVKVCRPPLTTVNVATATLNKMNQRMTCTSIAEDSDSTNNSLASSSGIGGSRDCSFRVEEENMPTSFEGILLNGAPTSNNMDIDAQEDGSSKDSSSVGSKDKPLQSMMLVDLLERKVDKEPILNGVLSKNSINEKEMDLVENHFKKVLKESPAEMKIKPEIESGNIIQNEVSEDTLIEAPRGIKRSASESDELDIKKPKYSNGTMSPDPAVDSTTAESTVSSIKSEEQDDDKDSEKATVSSTAANLYAALAADCIEDEIDLEEQMNVNILIKEEPPTLHIKEESHIFINQIASMNQASQPQPPSLQQQQQQLIVTTPRQIVVQQTIPSSNQMIIPTTSVKGRPPPQQPQVLLQQSAGGQLQYVVSGGVPGQNYVLAQPQTALVQGQAQTVLVAQTTQQQGTGTKTIIILQPQATAQPTPQKMVAVTPQGQQVVVTQVPRPILQSPALGNIPPPLVPTSATIPQASIIVNSSVAQTNPNTVTVTIPAMAQQTPVSTSVPSRVVTPTPASTPPPTRPTTPHQAAATHGVSTVKSSPATKIMKTVSSSTSTEPESKPSTSQQQQQQTPQLMQENKTITIKIDPNAYLCEWRGCLRQFKTPHEVYLHVCEAHCPNGGEEILCLWASCDALKRRKFSLMTHLYDRHCNADTMSMRRKQLTVTGKTEVSTSTPPAPHHPGYAPNAAFHAIKRHALEFVNPKELMSSILLMILLLAKQQRPTKPAAATSSSSSPRPGQNSPPEQDDNEGPVTKSIRLTAALILRNLVIYSTHGRRHLRAYEPHLAGVALSNVESSRTIAQVLYDMNDQSSSSHHR